MAQKTSLKTTILLVRHAEKKQGQNPSLTSQGQQRAQNLITKVQPWALSGVYSTNFNRTRETAQPVAKTLGLKVNASIPPMNYKALLKDIEANHKGRAVLVVGHSNTTPEFVNYLDASQKLPFIDEKDYSQFYILELHEDGRVVFKKETY